jgi:hypothetical protein
MRKPAEGELGTIGVRAGRQVPLSGFDGAPFFDTSPRAAERPFFLVSKDGSGVVKTAAPEVRAYWAVNSSVDPEKPPNILTSMPVDG